MLELSLEYRVAPLEFLIEGVIVFDCLVGHFSAKGVVVDDGHNTP